MTATTGPALYVPASPTQFDQRSAERWFDNIVLELDDGSALAPMREYYRSAGLIDRPRRTAFFRSHFGRSVVLSVRHLFTNRSRPPRILDLGCGVGTQSLLFASLGATVLALDMDAAAIDILKARVPVYERAAGRPLAIRAVSARAHKVDYRLFGEFDAVYSLFAFQMMLPYEPLLKAIGRAVAPGARLSIHDGNRDWLFVLGRRKYASVQGYRRLFESTGWRVDIQQMFALWPPALWAVVPGAALASVESVLRPARFLYRSCLTLGVYGQPR